MTLRHIVILSISLVFWAAPSACHKDRGSTSTIQARDTGDDQALDTLLRETRDGIKEVQAQLLATYPPEAHSYVFAGRSPTPLYAAMGPRTKSRSIPFSDLKHQPFLSLDGVKNTTFFLQKALDHIHVYAGSLLAEMVSNRAPARIVVVDFTASGISLGRFLNLLDLYLKDRVQKDPLVKAWVTKNGLPKIIYFAMAPLALDSSLAQLQKIIAEQKIIPEPARPKVITTHLVKPGDPLGTIPKEIDTEALVQSWTGLETGPWEGFVLNLSVPKWAMLKYHLARSSFDPYAPYGSWSIHSSPLEAQSPPVSAGFVRLKKALAAKDGSLWTRCFRPQAQ